MTELHCLTGAPELVRAAQKINMGVLPVQPPSFIYRRAEKDAHGLSWVALRPPADGTVTGAEVVGSAIAELQTERDGRQHVQLRTLAVPARHRRSGVGRQLVERVIQQAREVRKEAAPGDQVPESVQLHVHIANEDAQAFYAALGFQEKARIENYYRRLEPRTALVLEYVLS